MSVRPVNRGFIPERRNRRQRRQDSDQVTSSLVEQLGNGAKALEELKANVDEAFDARDAERKDVQQFRDAVSGSFDQVRTVLTGEKHDNRFSHGRGRAGFMTPRGK